MKPRLTPRKAISPRQGIDLMIAAQLLVLICILLAATLAALSWQLTLLLAIPPTVGGALLSWVRSKFPR
ncbi:hypothetical protein [Aeromonas cavernicola]|uniref:Uncharacterized protein n=1 Tax=Aeromonas cavernicola TaxID=1006623 RepID=A0A2H9U6H2_9GAMM|nr:hypothetical protein [Aeromonas cavernicola]PJG59635.1 hypothetical protein CUC53_06200 [Aeromonas cavernicola]